MKKVFAFIFFASLGIGTIQAQDGFDYLALHRKENTVVIERIEQNIVERVKMDNQAQSLTKSKHTDLNNTAKQLVRQGWEISAVTKEAYYFRKKQE